MMKKGLIGCGGCLGLIIIIVIISAAINGTTRNTSSNSNSTSPSNTSTTNTATVTVVPTRQVVRTSVTLGAGTFQGGKDVAVGLYDVTTQNGESGNFIVSGTDSIDEILGIADGQGVAKVRTKISSDDKIEISSLNHVIFTPVTAPSVTTYKKTTLYAGTWTVGQDIAPGRYVATTTAGSSGNFIVSGVDDIDEILGIADGQGVANVTTDLSSGDTIDISSLNEVDLTPTK